ncbi:NlpC/P60 family protein [Pseudomonas sp. MAFF 212408]|uniref:NlpC/P60 family protein n=2 Tax=Pseudomonas kitaguniensis TaxID=2607908 RepID=A0A5N7KJR2_9PSED|nr:NlpC/P60 family protein [Pseudomonas kitaguniensis]
MNIKKPSLNRLKPADHIVGRAHELIGTRYRWGGNTVSGGFDCSGLMVYLFRSEAGITLPRSAASMFTGEGKKIARHQLKRGDAIFFKTLGHRRGINHVGVYIGNGRFIHAPRSGKTTRIDSLNNTYWNKHYVAGKRLH